MINYSIRCFAYSRWFINKLQTSNAAHIRMIKIIRGSLRRYPFVVVDIIITQSYVIWIKRFNHIDESMFKQFNFRGGMSIYRAI